MIEQAVAGPRAAWLDESCEEERRRCPRYEIRGAVRVLVRGHAGSRMLQSAELVDSSAVGIGLRMSEPTPEGARVLIFFDTEPLPGRSGCVARCVADDRGGYVVGVDCWNASTLAA